MLFVSFSFLVFLLFREVKEDKSIFLGCLIMHISPERRNITSCFLLRKTSDFKEHVNRSNAVSLSFHRS